MVEAEAFFPWEEVHLAGADGIITLLAEQFGPGLQAAVLVIVAQLVRHNEDNIGTVHCIFSMKFGTIVMELPTKIGQEAKGGNNGK